MKTKLLALPVIALLVAACGDSDTLEIEAKTDNPDLVFSYPTDGQRNVSPAAQVILRFSEPVDTESLKASAKLTAGTDVVDYSLERTDGGYSVS
ncbi:hypothetical protein DOQ08_00789 [Marinobacter litoralis]|uniref:SbsA Ig-like domain-containing protein n=1 Tax=Marinobacter litoralis TaxID=187981 RepID=A0A3M2RML1_9GAMM|nr:Ig-like domain-containing protein [Marinobacter litoralis]RMJ06105.1 hypothetical protein DOQ08_00789 [Marinobacter litoralis]